LSWLTSWATGAAGLFGRVVKQAFSLHCMGPQLADFVAKVVDGLAEQ
jgi:hypothetical protein